MKGDMDAGKLRLMESKARTIGHRIGEALDGFDERMGFVLMLFSFEGPEFTWISNAQRDDMIRALEEFIGKYKSGEASQTSAGKN